MIDICDFAVGLSRQLYGLTIASERPGHAHARDLAPAGRVRRHHRLQLPRRGLGLERGAGAGLRRPGDLEAVGEDAADARWPPPRIFERAARPLRRCAGRPAAGASSAAARPARRWSRTRDVAIVSATGSTRMGRAVAPAVAAALRPLHPRARRQQRHDRRALGRPRHGAARDRVLGRRHLRPALHHPAPPDRPRRRSTTRCCRALKAAYAALPIGDPLRGRRRWSAR